MNEQYISELLRQVGVSGAASAMSFVENVYREVHGRSAYDDIGSIGFVAEIARGRQTPAQVEANIRQSLEHQRRAEGAIRAIYLELLGRDPGPHQPDEAWADGGALVYVEDYQMGRKTLDEIRENIVASEEYQSKHRHRVAEAIAVKDFVLEEPKTGSEIIGLGTSLFYAMSPDVSREEYVAVLDELADVGIEFARFAGSTFTWDNPVGMANVIPFRAGSAYRHADGVDAGRSVDFRPDDNHFAELGWRLDQAKQRGIHVQYTIFWGGMQPLFTTDAAGKVVAPGNGGHQVRWGRVEEYVRYVARFFRNRQEHTLEIVNEIDHGHHLARQGWDGRKEFIRRCAKWIREEHVKAVITVSDGGHGPQLDGKRTEPAPEGSPYFDYHDVSELDYWNVHYPRETVEVQGIPRWCRGSWHLYQDRGPFRRAHPGKGYGRSDENIFLTTEDEFRRWGYRGSTRDWRMYGLSLWVTAMAGAGFTVHNFKGFFCKPDVGRDPVFNVICRAFADITRDFAWHGSTPYNTAWRGSPVRDYSGPYKAFAMESGRLAEKILITVLNPSAGKLVLDLKGKYIARIFEVTGEQRGQTRVSGIGAELRLPPVTWSHGCIVRLDWED